MRCKTKKLFQMRLLKFAAMSLMTLAATTIQAQNLDNDFKALQNQVETSEKCNYRN